MSKRKRQYHGRSPTKKRQEQRNTSSLVIPIIVGVVVVALIVGAIIASESQRAQTAGAAPVVTAQAQSTGSIPNPNVPRITLQETTEKLEQGQAVLIDVRSKASYDKAHASGALSIPEEEVAARLDEFPQDKDLVLYWTWGQEQQSARVAQMLMDQGFTNAKALLGGFAAWQRSGLPVETSTP